MKHRTIVKLLQEIEHMAEMVDRLGYRAGDQQIADIEAAMLSILAATKQLLNEIPPMIKKD